VKNIHNMLAKTGSVCMARVSSGVRTAGATTSVLSGQFRSLSSTSTIPAEELVMLAIRGRSILEEYSARTCVAGAAAANSSNDVNVQDEPSNDTIIEDTAAEFVADEPVERRKSIKDSLTAIIGAGGELSQLHPLQP
jgi:hypothetical protein